MDRVLALIIIVTFNAMSSLEYSGTSMGRVPGVGPPFFGQSMHLNEDIRLEPHLLKMSGSASGVFAQMQIIFNKACNCKLPTF